jgi:hypothetical protein
MNGPYRTPHPSLTEMLDELVKTGRTMDAACAEQPFVLDERHRCFYTLAGPSDLARNFDETQCTEPPLADATSLSQRPHVAIKCDQYRIVRLGCGAN